MSRARKQVSPSLLYVFTQLGSAIREDVEWDRVLLAARGRLDAATLSGPGWFLMLLVILIEVRNGVPQETLLEVARRLGVEGSWLAAAKLAGITGPMPLPKTNTAPRLVWDRVSDLRWMLGEFSKLDRDGSTEEIWHLITKTKGYRSLLNRAIKELPGLRAILRAAPVRGAPRRNEARNAWVVAQRKKGMTYQKILDKLQEKKGWDQVSSTQAIHLIFIRNSW